METTEKQVQRGSGQPKIIFPVSSLSDMIRFVVKMKETSSVFSFHFFCVRELDGNTAIALVSLVESHNMKLTLSVCSLTLKITKSDSDSIQR